MSKPWAGPTAEAAETAHSFLVMKAVAEFYVDFARVVPVISAEGEAVVKLDAAIGYV